MYITGARDRSSLYLKEFKSDHSHEISEELFKCYPEARHLPKDEEKEVEKLLDLGMPSEKIHLYLQENDHVVTNKDIHNIKTKVRSRVPNDMEDVTNVLDNLVAADTKASIKLKKTDDRLDVIFFQTSSMKTNAKHFGDVLHLDGTYRVNNRCMPLYTIPGQGNDGKGVVLAQAVMATETAENIRFLLRSYKENTDRMPSCVVIDKDFTEIESARAVFEDVDIILCKFHTLKTFKKETTNITDARVKFNTRQILTKLVYARSEEEFDECYGSLVEVAPTDFVNYFDKNWKSCTDMWSAYKVNEIAHHGNTTTNRLESFHQKMKAHLDRNMTLAECLKTLLRIHHSMLEKKSHQERLARLATFYEMKTCIEVESAYRDFASSFAAKHVIGQLRQTAKTTLTEAMETTNCSCKCPFFATKELPCRHIFVKRSELGLPLFTPELVPQRWRSASASDDEDKENRDPNCPQVVVTAFEKKLSKKLTRTQKFQEMMATCQEIAQVISMHSMKKYSQELSILKRCLKKWKIAEDVMIDLSDDVEEPEHAEPVIPEPVMPDQDLETPIDLSSKKSRCYRLNLLMMSVAFLWI